ncbi:extracellular solute-binding protein [Kineococcus sp. R8]|uniref:ABC transporter substrate-binding protein n=1 Tax=Kineococcus siccus TaxID=2696567 RepID=UPI0014128330|nr:extracellular solute-binding protein [Kineococcus siccus]NAZ83006.1 extracellular solute-binding protein [Kineococcus siccus]
MPRHRVLPALAAALLVAAGGTACTAGPRAQEADVLTVWNLDGQPDRIAAAKAIDAGFTRSSGVRIDQVPVDESQLPSLIVSAAVSGTMPDVIAGLPLGVVRQLAEQDLLDTAAAGDVVRRLDPATFSDTSLALTRDGQEQLAVPSDVWAQILVYRKDLFERAGLAPPTTYATIADAARVLTVPERKGITLATDPGDPFTSQTFESLALGNDCALVDDAGDVGLDAAPCRAAFDLYGQLTRSSPSGTQTVDSTRATYFAGQAAMTIWSTFLLDELAGLRDDALPTCPECRADPEWLARTTGIVTAVQGPDGAEPVSYGEVSSWAITGTHGPAAADYVEHMMSTGYLAALAIAPEGKYPARRGTPAAPTEFTDAWPTLPAGVDRRRPLADVYGRQTMDEIGRVADTLQRWAIPEGQGALLGPVNAELPVPKVLAEIAGGGTSAREGAREAAEAVEEIQRSLT